VGIVKVAIHQPHYWPWLGYLRKMKEADVFVYLDGAEFTKNGFQNRSLIQINGNEHWLTIPVLTKNRAKQLIKNTEANPTDRWELKHYHTLLYNYSKEMKKKGSEMKLFFGQDHNLLIDWCIKSIDFLCRAFEIDTERILESELNIKSNGTKRLVDICRHLNADIYLSGPSGKKYMDERAFGDIRVEYMDWKPKSKLSALHFYLRGEEDTLEDK